MGASPTEFTSQRRPCALPRAGSRRAASGVPPHPNTPVPSDAPPHASSSCVVSACLPIRRATTAPLTTAPCVSVGANTTAAPLTTAPVSPAALSTRLRRSAYVKHRPKQKQCRFRCAAPFFPLPQPPRPPSRVARVELTRLRRVAYLNTTRHQEGGAKTAVCVRVPMHCNISYAAARV